MPKYAIQPRTQVNLRTVPLRVWARTLLVSLLFVGFFRLQEVPPGTLPVFEGDLFALRRAAEAEDKLCLIRIYTDYCYACEGMETQLAAEPMLVETILADYLPYQIKNLSGTEGQDLARRHQLRQAPLLLITDSEGRELSRFAYLPPTHQLIDTLFRLARLRTAPGAPPDLTRPEGQAQPAAFGLRLQSTDTYGEAWAYAQANQEKWNQPLYIFPNPGEGYEVLVGVYEDKESTKVMQTFLKAWEERDLPLVEVARDVALEVNSAGQPLFQSQR